MRNRHVTYPDILKPHIQIAILTRARIHISLVKTIDFFNILTIYAEIRTENPTVLSSYCPASHKREPYRATQLRHYLTGLFTEKLPPYHFAGL